LFGKLRSWLFGSPEAVASDLRRIDPERWEASLLDRVKEMSAEDPLIGAKIGGKELAHRLIDAMTDQRGVHVESLMCAAGALAGYSCQAALRAKNRAAGAYELAEFTEARTSDGQTFFSGDALNKYLAEDQLSIWSLAAGGAQACGCTNFPDVRAIFSHVAESIGKDHFGVPRVSPEHPVHELPRVYLERLWPRFRPMMERFCPEPTQRPALFGVAVQELLKQTKGALDSCIALQIVMESAIPMSKVNWLAAQPGG